MCFSIFSFFSMFNLKKIFFEIWMKKVLETVWVSTPYMLKEEKYYIYIVYSVYSIVNI